MTGVRGFGCEELEKLLKRRDFSEIFQEADTLRKARKGNDILIRGLLEFSSFCKRRCRYCGLNCENHTAARFRLEPSEIIETALEAAEAGYRTIVLQSGEDGFYTPEMIGDITAAIKRTGTAVTLSCGEHSREVYAYWRSRGADRYLLKHETADEGLYASLHPDGSLEERLQCLREIKALSYETGGGFMVGLPGQTLQTIAKDLLMLKRLSCDMAGIGPFIPHPATSLKNAESGSTALTKRAVALARILLPDANLPATTALGVLDREEKQSVFDCGANVVMQKITPVRVRRQYEIYPADLPPLDIPSGRKQIEEYVGSLGRNPL